jgi:hypothetical protein
VRRVNSLVDADKAEARRPPGNSRARDRLRRSRNRCARCRRGGVRERGRLTGGVLIGLSAGGLSTGGLSSASLAFVKVQITVSSAASSMVAVAPGGPSG